jgi:hypothetical protein
MWEDMRDATDRMYDKALKEYFSGLPPENQDLIPRPNPDIPTISSRPKRRH